MEWRFYFIVVQLNWICRSALNVCIQKDATTRISHQMITERMEQLMLAIRLLRVRNWKGAKRNNRVSLLALIAFVCYSSFFFIVRIKASNQNENERALDKVNELHLIACASSIVISSNQRKEQKIDNKWKRLSRTTLSKRLGVIMQFDWNRLIYKERFRQIFIRQPLCILLHVCLDRERESVSLEFAGTSFHIQLFFYSVACE